MKCIQAPNPHPYSTAETSRKFMWFPWRRRITGNIYVQFECIFLTSACHATTSSLTVCADRQHAHTLFWHATEEGAGSRPIGPLSGRLAAALAGRRVWPRWVGLLSHTVWKWKWPPAACYLDARRKKRRCFAVSTVTVKTSMYVCLVNIVAWPCTWFPKVVQIIMKSLQTWRSWNFVSTIILEAQWGDKCKKQPE